jgi:hypothetical protein
MLAFNKEYLKSFAGAFRYNLKGKSVSEKLVIIESDDWGAIRTPSRDALEAFKEKGFSLHDNFYNNDALESRTDLEGIFEVLESVKGKDGKPATLSANAVMANPDFEKIKAANFQQYFYEKVDQTFNRYPEHQGNLDLWKEGMKSGIFQPQFHGREHLNYKRWLKALQNGEDGVRYSFEWGATYSGKGDYNFMEAYDWDSKDDIPVQEQVIIDGLRLYREYFSKDAETFIAPCYNWDPDLEPALAENNVQVIQGGRNQLVPTGTFDKYLPIRHHFGEVNEYGTIYNVRNCFFEPSMNSTKDWVDSCLAQIQHAFLFRKPAVICSHRVNYIGFIDSSNRDRGLKGLQILLKRIKKEWPEARFISTDQLKGALNTEK